MAEALLRARLEVRAPDVVVGSVGQLFEGRPAEDGAVHALRKRGLDLRSHLSRVQSAERLSSAALVLGMEQAHVRGIALLAPDLFPRTYTLPEFVGIAVEAGARPVHEPLRAWVERLGAHRNPRDQLADDRRLEIADPMGRSDRVFRSCAEQIDMLLATLVDLAWPATSSTNPGLAGSTTGDPHADRHRR